MKAVLLLSAVLLAASSVSAECPNGCSGHGDCGAFDMCTCYRNFEGADCAHRTCPYGVAHTTTPQGDLNLDGDLLDNSNKILSEFGTINVNTDQLTFKASSGRRSAERDGILLTSGGVEQTELKVGDGLRICDETFYVTALGTLVNNLISSVTVDHVATKTCTDFYVYKHLVTQSRPVGDWEMWVGDFHGSGNMHDHEKSGANAGVLDDSSVPSGRFAQDEGHFYMECSNQGLCDRKTGVCECFDGYTGVACARQACPNDCSGHGTCQTVGELRSQDPVKLLNANSGKPATCYGSRGSDTLTCDTAVSVAVGDYIQIHPYAPMKVEGISANVITLFNHFPDVVPFGTEIFKVNEYGLWDADKNSACVCDPRWSGDDCSLKKCPRGDDPLTVVSTDPNPNGKDADTDGYSGDSDYTQRPEKQTLIIDSAEQGAIGHFYLQFTDFYGDSFSTLPIPMEVQLSVQASVSATTVTFEGAGLPADELTRGDTVRIGSSYKRVVSLTYKETDSPSTRGLFIATATLDSGAISGNGGSGVFLDGTRIYRTDVSKEIREALQSVPNGRIEGVSVEKIDRTGRYAQDLAGDMGSNSYLSVASGTQADHVVVGDIVRVGSELVRVEDTGTADQITTASVMSSSVLNGNPVYIQNGAKYRINFETGCKSDSECNSNGVDGDDSDAGAICTLGGSCLCSDAADSDSNWPKATGHDTDNDESTNNAYFYHGKGCTASGKGNHQGAYMRSNSGNIPALTCDKSRIYSGYVTHISAAVSRTSPQKIHFESTVGAKDAAGNADFATGKRVYIDGQVRTITKVTGTVLTVDEPFKTNEFSDDQYVFPTGSWVYLLHRDGGAGITCTASDITPLTSTSLAKTMFTSVHNYAQGKLDTKDVSLDTSENAVTAQRKIDIVSSGSTATFVHDEDELHVGDRVRLQDTSDASVFETRTVDEIFYDSANQITSFTVDSVIKASANVYIFVDNRGTTEELACSRRGLCDESTGTCECFSGYTDDDCSRQDSLFAA